MREVTFDTDQIIIKRAPLTPVQHIEAALESLRNGKQPETDAKAVESYYAPMLQPKLIKLAPNGKRLAGDSSDTHHGVLIPGVLLCQDLIIDAREAGSARNWEEACEKGAKVELFGEKAQLWLPEEAQLIIRRDLRNPACDKNMFPRTPTSDWIWTRRKVEPEDPASSSVYAWYVSLNYGDVGWCYRSFCGRVVASRLVPAGQF